MKTKLTPILFLLIIIGIAAFLYVNSIFLPLRLKQIVVDRTQKFLDRKVTVGEINYNFIKGATIRNLTIYKKKNKQWPVVHIGEINFKVLIPAIFKNQKIVVPSITIKNPYIHLIRTGNAKWNFSDLLNKQQKSAGKSLLPLVLGGFNIEQALVVLVDKRITPSVTGIINKADIKIAISLTKKIKYDLKLYIPQQPSIPSPWKEAGSLAVTGTYNPHTQKATAHIAGEKVNPSAFIAISSTDRDIALKEIVIADGEADIIFQKKENGIMVDGNIFLNDSVLRFQNAMQLSGATMVFKDSSFSREKGIRSFKGQTRVTEADLQLPENMHLNGNLTARDVVFTIQDRKVDVRGYLETQQASFLSSDNKKIDIPDLSGSVRYANDTLTWKELKGIFKNTEYTLNGQVANPARPIVDTDVAAPHLTFSTKTKILNQALTVVSLSGIYYDSPFNFTGEIHFKKNVTTSGPFLDIKVHSDFQLTDLSRLRPLWEEKLKVIRPSGTLPVDVLFKGTLQDWRNAIIVASSTEGNISLWGYKLKNVTGKFEQGDREYSPLDITGFLYDGPFSLTSQLYVKKENTPSQVSLKLENTNLSKLKKDSPLKDKEIAGLLSLALNLKGPLEKINEIMGGGALVIRDGHLWKFNLLKGLWSVLLIPELENIVFTEAATSFAIENKRVTTHNLFLTSESVDILGEGWIDLDKNIAFTIIPKIKESTIIDSDSLKKAPTAILAQVAQNTSIKISGTLGNPKFEKTILPGQIIKKATGAMEKATGDILEGVQDILQEGVKEILEGIFQ